ncbi:MAG TPA: HipA domain-containing protein [Candidatus Cloacimonadota bacterium]|nr:HipA domain-containing protein [Candidatus Cloacimonadota bacterium]
MSGVQDKISLKLDSNQLIPTQVKGEYILKPVPAYVPEFQNDVPANEHLTMQIARQIFKIGTAENAIIPFQDGELAYLTKRFDRRNENKLHMEDLCQLMEITPETHGENFKYESSYQEVGNTLKQFCDAPKIEIEKLYKIIFFNYVFGNGDAHLKNFSLIESVNDDFILSPAYDLINTYLHFPEESRMALDLFTDFETEFFQKNGFYGRVDFLKLAEFYGIKSERAQRMINAFLTARNHVCEMIKSSFLSEPAQEKYLDIYADRMKAIT